MPYTVWIYTLLERAVFLNHLLGVKSVSDCERSMALELGWLFQVCQAGTNGKIQVAVVV